MGRKIRIAKYQAPPHSSHSHSSHSHYSRSQAPLPSAPARILMTADTLGGVWCYALELARELERYGTQVMLVSMGAPLSRSQRAETNRLKNTTVYETNFRLEWMDAPWADVDEAGAQLLELERTFAPDLIHLNGYAHGALPWQSPVLVAAHSCVLSWWQAVYREPAPPQLDLYRKRILNGLLGADLVVAPSRAMLDSLKTNYGYPGPGRVIPNGRGFCNLGVGRKDPFIMAAGRLWDQAKNFAMLNRVAPRLRWPVVIAGDSRHPNGSNLSFPHLKCLGLLAPKLLSEHLGRAAIYAFPVRYEPFGLSILEAALSGCALVLGDLPSLRELWGEAAIYVSPWEDDSLYEAINSLIASKKQRTELGTKARQQALRFSSLAMGRAYLALYHDLISLRTKDSLQIRGEPCGG